MPPKVKGLLEVVLVQEHRFHHHRDHGGVGGREVGAAFCVAFRPYEVHAQVVELHLVEEEAHHLEQVPVVPAVQNDVHAEPVLRACPRRRLTWRLRDGLAFLLEATGHTGQPVLQGTGVAVHRDGDARQPRVDELVHERWSAEHHRVGRDRDAGEAERMSVGDGLRNLRVRGGLSTQKADGQVALGTPALELALHHLEVDEAACLPCWACRRDRRRTCCCRSCRR